MLDPSSSLFIRQWQPQPPRNQPMFLASTVSVLQQMEKADLNRDGQVSQNELDQYANVMDMNLQIMDMMSQFFGNSPQSGALNNAARQLRQDSQTVSLVRNNFQTFASVDGRSDSISPNDVRTLARRDGNINDISRLDLGRRPQPPVTTMAVGEEGGWQPPPPNPRPPAYGGPQPPITTMAVDEEGGWQPPPPNPRPPAYGGPQPPLTTRALNEEGGGSPPIPGYDPTYGGQWPPQQQPPGQVTTQALGEEGGGNFSWPQATIV
jgi:hypothetical protein